MFTLTVTLADGGQGTVNDAISMSDTASIHGFTPEETFDILMRAFEANARQVVESFMAGKEVTSG